MDQLNKLQSIRIREVTQGSQMDPSTSQAGIPTGTSQQDPGGIPAIGNPANVTPIVQLASTASSPPLTVSAQVNTITVTSSTRTIAEQMKTHQEIRKRINERNRS